MNTSSSPGPRVKRGESPAAYITERNYRLHAREALFRDFASRCAYSMQHVDLAGGDACMEIDHHNPTLKAVRPQPYSNLFLATRHCNGHKGDRWPDGARRAKGIRFLNCCEEQDYGVHIRENIRTGELVGMTPAGTYHIEMLALNAPHLVRERQRRTELHNLLHGPCAVTARLGCEAVAQHAIAALQQEYELRIPRIAPWEPPKAAPAAADQDGLADSRE